MIKLSNLSKLVALTGIAVAILGGTALATDVDLGPTDDAMIFGTSSKVDTGNASGKGPGLFAGTDGNSSIKRSLLLFDLSGQGSGFTSAELDLYIGQIAGTGGGGGSGGGCSMGCTYPTRNFAIYPSTTAWAEGKTGDIACGGSPCSTMGGTGQGWSYTTCGTSTSSPCLDDVTWKYYDYDGNSTHNLWSHATTDQDYGYGTQGTAMATMTVSSPFFVSDMESFTCDFTSTNVNFCTTLRDWVVNTGDNLGLELRSTNLEASPTSFLGFWSKDGAAAASNGMAPVLVLHY